MIKRSTLLTIFGDKKELPGWSYVQDKCEENFTCEHIVKYIFVFVLLFFVVVLLACLFFYVFYVMLLLFCLVLLLFSVGWFW